MRMAPIFCSTLLAAIAAFAAPAQAADEETAALIEALRGEITALQDRLAMVESRQKITEQSYSAPKAPATPPPRAASWADTIKIKGDLRYRHEGFEVEDRRDRHRQRIRARTSLTAAVSDTVSVGFGLASGGDDPISTNQTLGDGASSKSVVIDLAYVGWKTPIEGLSVTAGKFKNPFHRAGGHSLVFDGDLNPEGFGANYEAGALFVNAGAFWVDESSSDDDSYMFGLQSGWNTELGDGELTAGVSYYNFLDSRGEAPFFDGDAQGNLLDSDGNYLSGFELLEGFAEYAFALNDAKVTLFADYVNNLEADDLETGWAVGANMKQNKWQVGYAYQDLEADAVLGTWTDSDFIGGGTDGKGHVLSAGYSLTSKISLKGTLFLNERNMDVGNEEDFRRLMLDVSFKY